MEKSITITGGLSFTSILQLAFIILKLCGVINWNWWLVLLPLIISGGFILIGVLMFVICLLICRHKEDNSSKLK